jgi:hypothetical protein
MSVIDRLSSSCFWKWYGSYTTVGSFSRFVPRRGDSFSAPLSKDTMRTVNGESFTTLHSNVSASTVLKYNSFFF